MFVASLFFSCQKPNFYEQYQVVENKAWGKDKEYYFTFRIDDISKPYNLSLQIRNNNLYPYQNLWVFILEEPPIGPVGRDTVECMLADEFGKWYGHGISLYESSFPIRENYYFPHKGQYSFGIRQAMRDSSLTGIQEIGLQVTTSTLLPRSVEADENK